MILERAARQHGPARRQELLGGRVRVGEAQLRVEGQHRARDGGEQRRGIDRRGSGLLDGALQGSAQETGTSEVMPTKLAGGCEDVKALPAGKRRGCGGAPWPCG